MFCGFTLDKEHSQSSQKHILQSNHLKGNFKDTRILRLSSK
jgi:hypothetical protein